MHNSFFQLYFYKFVVSYTNEGKLAAYKASFQLHFYTFLGSYFYQRYISLSILRSASFSRISWVLYPSKKKLQNSNLWPHYTSLEETINQFWRLS